MLMRMSTMFFVVFASLPLMIVSSNAEWNSSKWDLVLLTDAAAQGAVCLDGSPGGYQIRPGAPGNTKWVVFHQGGGWCVSDEGCAARANTALGSSKQMSPFSWGPTYTDTYEGSQLFQTPPFATATLVYALYCDGGSWSGNAAKPVVAKPNATAPAQTIYYRGRPLLDALYDHLLTNGLSGASELLFSGCSAGGLTVYMHADYIAGRMPSTVKTVALADAMYSIDTVDVAGYPVFPDLMSWVFNAMNSSASVNQGCLEANPNGTECMFGVNTAPHVKTPLFVINSKYDTWQAGGIIGAGTCGHDITNCSTKIQTFWSGYADKMVDALIALPPQHGGFLSNCQAHCQTGTASAWMNLTVNGATMGESFVTWYNETMAVLRDQDEGGHGDVVSAGQHRHYETCNITVCPGDTCH
eukprot:m.53174 g.53174  ORF g.53174 m.53174 type:complete len:412 (-) comp21719_c0_seq1:72-1307(-)